MAISKLATPYKFQNWGAKRWWDGRSKKITTIVIHHPVTTNFNSMPDVWFSREASAHYGIGQNGEIRAYVDENNTAWHCKNGNEYSIGIECTNIGLEPDYKVSDKTVDALVELIKEIQSRLGKLEILAHRDVPGNNTVCCGSYLYSRMQEIRDRVNSKQPEPPRQPEKPQEIPGIKKEMEAKKMMCVIEKKNAKGGWDKILVKESGLLHLSPPQYDKIREFYRWNTGKEIPEATKQNGESRYPIYLSMFGLAKV